LGELLGPSAPGYQGEVVDRILPSERRARLVVTDEGALVRAARDEISFLSVKGRGDPVSEMSTSDVPKALAAAIDVTRHSFDASHLVELGVGCESCHGGSREHVANPTTKPSFEIRSSFVRAEAGAESRGSSALAHPRERAIDRACARCHQVLFSRYPFTWEGGARHGDPGGSHISSGEARDFLLGGCASSLSCTACHDPHAADAPDKLRAMETVAGNELCLGCHGKFRGERELAAHTHHASPSAGAVCINCHMPQKNMGLGYQLTRYHRIGSPNEKARVESDRPLECALCHVDKSTLELVNSMETFWGKRYDRKKLELLYGDLGSSPLLATVTRGKAHEQATAIHVLGQARVAAALPSVAEQMCNPFPLVRYYARQALGQITGRACEIDLDRDNADIRAETARFLASPRTVR
jgi:predicted CXXCH cytochrome family protein